MKIPSQTSALAGFFLPYTLIITISFLIYLTAEYSQHKNTLSSNEKIQIELAKTSLIRDFEIVLPDINVLVNENHLQQYINSPDTSSRQLAIEGLKTFLSHKRLYLMARILNLEGLEQIRVEYYQGEPNVIPEQQLQDKSQCYYFKESIKFNMCELYISPIDLIMEHGEIASPHTPAIRFAIGLYNKKGIKTGILILNYLAQPMLEHFDEMLASSAGHVAIVNHNGYWIRSHVKQREWGFMLQHNHKFSSTHPEAWTEIKKKDSGQILTRDGLFTYTTIYPIELIGGYSEHEVDNIHIGHHHIDPKLYSWKIISDIPNNIIYRNISQHILGGLGALWLVLMIIGFMLSRHFSLNYIERKKLKQQNELHAKIYDTTTDGIFITNADKQIIACNQAFTTITGYSEQEVIGLPLQILSSNIDDYGFYKRLWNDLNKKGYWVGEITNKHKQGYVYNEWLRITSIYDDDANIINYVAIITDITKIKQREQRLQELASRDALTGLYNRHAFYIKLENEIKFSRENNSKIALLFIDLDDFKPVNDRYGHNAGDAILIAVAKRIQNKVRNIDTVARIGGDEFTVVLKNIDSRENAEKTKHSIQQAVQEPIHHYDHQLFINASIGIALFPDDADNTNALVKYADQNMYSEKQKK